MLAFSSSSNFSELLSFGLVSNGATPGFVFNLSRVCAQNILGLVLDLRAMPRSNDLFAFRSNVFTLFLALAYSRRAFSVSLRLIDAIHVRCFFFLSWIASCLFIARKIAFLFPCWFTRNSSPRYKLVPKLSKIGC